MMNACRSFPLLLGRAAILFSSSLVFAGEASVIEVAAPIDTAFLDEEDFYAEIPLVSSATRLKQKITDTPVAISIIDSNMIRASGVTEIPELLRLVPGFLNYRVVGNQFGVTNRGSTNQFPGDLEVLVDGRSVYGTFSSTVEWSSLAITVEDIEYIEVIRSSNSPAFGSNAFLGAINIVTHSPLQTQGTELSAIVGDWQTRGGRLRQSVSAGGVKVQIGLSYLENEGFPPDLTNNDGNPGNRIIDGNRRLHGFVKGIYVPSLNDTIEFDLGGGRSDLEVPEFEFPLIPDFKGFIKREFRDDYQHVLWKRQGRENNAFQLRFYRSRFVFNDRQDLGLLSGAAGIPPALIPIRFGGNPDQLITLAADKSKSERYDLELQHTLDGMRDHKFVWGLGARYDRTKSPFLLARPDYIGEMGLRLFGNWAWKVNKALYLNTGLMIEDNDITHSYLSPRLGVNITVLPDHVLRFSYAEGNRSPSLIEANEDQIVRLNSGDILERRVVAGDVDETRLREYEIGYIGRYFDDRLNLDLRVVRTEVRDALAEIREPFDDLLNGVLQRIENGGQWNSNGIDLQLSANLSSNSRLWMNYSYTDLDSSRIRQRVPVFELRNLDDSLPRHRASLLLEQKFNDSWSASMWWSYLSEVDWFTGDLTESYDRLDLRLVYEFRINDSAFELELLGENVFSSYEEFRPRNDFERRVFFRLKMHFP